MKTGRRNVLAALTGAATLPFLRAMAPAQAAGEQSPAPSSGGSSKARRISLAEDPLRPQFHLLPRANWMNDPNGPIYWNGQYHMFYQFNPDGAYWGNMHWGHAVSPDMVHWRHLAVALAPAPDSPDADGCFTGTAVIQDRRATILYTGARSVSPDEATSRDGPSPLKETQCLAVARDADLMVWEKTAAPVIAAPPPGVEVNGFRDPSPWRQGEWWYTVLGSGIAGEGGAVLLYRSLDLRNWEYMHILARRRHAAAFDPFDPWEAWECPEFFPLGDRHVLIYSAGGKAQWQTGRLDTGAMTFHAEQAGVLDYGAYYAPKTQLDRNGNRILWGWIPETRPLEESKAAGWAGMMSLPRVLCLSSNGRLRFQVTGEVNQLRSREQVLKISGSADELRQRIDSIRVKDCCGEVLFRARRGREPFELMLHGGETSLVPRLALKYDPSRRDRFHIDGRPLPLELGENEDLEIHLYADGSVMELFVNHQAAWVKRFYFTGGRDRDLCFKWTGTAAGLVSLSAWDFTPISRDRLTT